MYESLFSDSKIPSAQTVYETSVALFMDRLLKKILSLYSAEVWGHMDDFDSHLKFEIAHLKAKEKAIDEYLNTKKMGTENHADFYQNILIDEIDKALIALNKTASIQIEKKELENENKALEDEAFKVKFEKEKEETQAKLASAKEKEWRKIMLNKNKLMEAHLEEYKENIDNLNSKLKNGGSAPRAGILNYFFATFLFVICYLRMK